MSINIPPIPPFPIGDPLIVGLEGLTLKTHTIDDDKDHDTGIYVDVVGNSRKLIADVADAQSSDNDSTHFDDGRVHSFDFSPVNDHILKDECTNFKWRMGIKASGGTDVTIEIQGIGGTFHHGNDRWTFDAWLTLRFRTVRR
jgi:hypothetical protein